MSRVAILLASFNGQNYIEDQISSLLGQVGVSLSIFIRDDGSTDKTKEILSRYSSHPNISLINDCEKTKSPAGNFFKLIQCVPVDDYDYIAFADQDDIWFPNKLRHAIDALKDNSADGYSSNLISFSNTSREFKLINKRGREAKFDFLFQGASAGCTYVISSQLALIVKDCSNKFPSEYLKVLSHDWIIYAICRGNNLKWVRDASSYILYRQHSANAWGAMTGATGLIKRALMAKTGWYRNHVLSLRNIVPPSFEVESIFSRVERMSFVDRIVLSYSTKNFRRSRKDAFMLSLVILLGIF